MLLYYVFLLFYVYIARWCNEFSLYFCTTCLPSVIHNLISICQYHRCLTKPTIISNHEYNKIADQHDSNVNIQHATQQTASHITVGSILLNLEFKRYLTRKNAHTSLYVRVRCTSPNVVSQHIVATYKLSASVI